MQIVCFNEYIITKEIKMILATLITAIGFYSIISTAINALVNF